MKIICLPGKKVQKIKEAWAGPLLLSRNSHLLNVSARSAFIILAVVFNSCIKKDGPKIPSDQKAREVIVGKWYAYDWGSSGKFILSFRNDGLYDRLYESGGTTSVLKDSLHYSIQNGYIDLPHDQVGPNPHWILYLDEKTFTYYRDNPNSENDSYTLNRLN